MDYLPLILDGFLLILNDLRHKSVYGNSGENTFLEAILMAPREGVRPIGIVMRGDVAGCNE